MENEGLGEPSMVSEQTLQQRKHSKPNLKEVDESLQEKIENRKDFLQMAQDLVNYAKYSSEVGANEKVDKFFDENVKFLKEATIGN